MRRLQFIVPVLCLLASCAEQRPVLQPAEVLRRSVVASNTLDSFAYVVNAGIRLQDAAPVMTGALSLEGTLRRERTVATGKGWVEISLPGPDGLSTVRIDGAYGVLPQQRPMIRVDGVTTASGGIFMHRDAGARWISLPIDDEPSPMQSGSRIDQRWIALQTSALQVTKDLGVEDGRYHYAVALNVDALQAMFGNGGDLKLRDTLRDRLNGEVWIDGENFLLTRALWRLKDMETDRGMLSLDVDVRLSGHNRAEANVAAPMPNQIEYPDDVIFTTIFSGALLPFMAW